MSPVFLPGQHLVSIDESFLAGDVIAFESGNRIFVHRLIARLPWPLHHWGLQRGDAHQLGSWIDLRTVVGKVVHPEVSRRISVTEQVAEIGCHLAWDAASRSKRTVLAMAQRMDRCVRRLTHRTRTALPFMEPS